MNEWGREVSIRCHGVHGLGVAEAQYHKRCYDKFRKIPARCGNTMMLEDNAMQSVIQEMIENRKHSTLTSLELYEMYSNFGGKLTQRQMLTRLVAHLLVGDSVIVLNIEGCASIVGFQEHMGKLFKIANTETVDEDREDLLVRKIQTGARAIAPNKNTYDLGEFTFTKTKEQTSATLLRLVSKLESDGETTKASISLSIHPKPHHQIKQSNNSRPRSETPS